MLSPSFVNGGLYLLRLISWIVLYYININFNWVTKGHSKFVSEAYLSNVSLDKDRMLHNLQPGLENNLRDCLQSKWKDFFIRGNYITTGQEEDIRSRQFAQDAGSDSW